MALTGQTDHRHRGCLRARLAQPAQRYLGKSGLEAAAGRVELTLRPRVVDVGEARAKQILPQDYTGINLFDDRNPTVGPHR